MIETNKIITCEYIGYKNILNNYNISIERGKIYGLVGPSGIGKTSLLKIMAMLETPDSGSYYYDGKLVDIRKDKIRSWYRNNKFGYISQNYSLIENLNAYENIMVPYRISGEKPDDNTVENICSNLGISQLLNRNVSKMSGGERQRVVIARAIVKKPEVLFADEPTSSLDRKNASEVIRILNKINEEYNTSIVIATHDECIKEICTKIIDM